MVRVLRCDDFWKAQIQSSRSWETAIDSSAILPTNLPEYDFLNVYKNHGRIGPQQLEWVPARVHKFQDSTGLGAPWKLSPPMIPPLRYKPAQFIAVHNISSPQEQTALEETLIRIQDSASKRYQSLLLPAQAKHYLGLEVEHHMTALLSFEFRRPGSEGSILTVTYTESYEDPSYLVPYCRSKGNRRDDSKALFGPQDTYSFRGGENIWRPGYCQDEDTEEIFMPFHFRTCRFIGLQIDIGTSDLALKGIEITMVNYSLDVVANFETLPWKSHEMLGKLWITSIRTLSNFMHGCYEDCPFYEQLQYVMDTRGSTLFTYYISGDDQLA